MKEVRLQKFIADCGITSRRKAEELITAGRVKVNGIVVRELGSKVNPEDDSVIVDGKVADLNSVEKVYLVMHKPRGVMTTVSDPEGRETVMDLCKEISERIYPVGRLDYLSEGLLIMTNDGDVANTIIHPSSDIVKVYEVKVFGSVNQYLLENLRAGAEVDGVKMVPKSVRVIKQLDTKTWLEFRITEGKNREIRKICEAHNVVIDKLKRVAIGGLPIEGIAPGKYRQVTKKQLLNLIGIDTNGRKLNDAFEFFSEKKTVSLKKVGAQHCTAADDKAFEKFKKESYFESLQKIKETKALKEQKLKEEAFAQKELEHQKRKNAKKARIAKKEHVRKHSHVQFVK